MMSNTNVEHETQAPEGTSYDLNDKEVSISRRAFLGGLVGFGAVLWGIVIAGVPVLSFLWPKKEEEITITELVFDKKIDEFPPGSSKNLMFGSIPVLLVHNANGTLSAFNAKCTHLGCTVQYQQDKKRIFCACHGGVYDPQSGKNVSGPPPAPLDEMVANVTDDGSIVIKRA